MMCPFCISHNFYFRDKRETHFSLGSTRKTHFSLGSFEAIFSFGPSQHPTSLAMAIREKKIPNKQAWVIHNQIILFKAVLGCTKNKNTERYKSCWEKNKKNITSYSDSLWWTKWNARFFILLVPCVCTRPLCLYSMFIILFPSATFKKHFKNRLSSI